MYFETIFFDLDDTLNDRNKSLCKFIGIFKDKYSYAMEHESCLKLKQIIFEIDFQGYKPREEMGEVLNPGETVKDAVVSFRRIRFKSNSRYR